MSRKIGSCVPNDRRQPTVLSRGLAICAIIASGLAGCGGAESDTQGARPSAAAPYTDRWDQGDHLRQLVAAQRFDAAAALIASERAYFAADWDTHRDTVARVADGLNAQFAGRLEAARGGLATVRWPAPQQDWPAFRQAFAAAQRVMDEYDAVPLFQDRTFRSDLADEVALRLAQDKARLDRFAPESFVLFDHFGRQSFFDVWPTDLDRRAFMSAHFGNIENQLSQATPAQLLRFRDLYPQDEVVVGRAAENIANLYVTAILADFGGPVADVKPLLEALIAANAQGFSPTQASGLTIAAADVSEGVPAAASARPFRAAIAPDLAGITWLGNRANPLATPDAQAADIFIGLATASSRANLAQVSTAMIPSTALEASRLAFAPTFVAAWRQAVDVAKGDPAEVYRLVSAQGPASAAADSVVSVMAVDGAGALLSHLQYREYAFRQSRFTGDKRVTLVYTIIDRRRGAQFEDVMTVNEQRDFKVLVGVRDNDPLRAFHFADGATEEEISQWDRQPMEVQLSALVNNFLGR